MTETLIDVEKSVAMLRTAILADVFNPRYVPANTWPYGTKPLGTL